MGEVLLYDLSRDDEEGIFLRFEDDDLRGGEPRFAQTKGYGHEREQVRSD